MQELRRTIRFAAALMFAVAVVATSNLGPVLFTVRGYHGVHLGDPLAFVLAGVWFVFGDPARSRRRESPDLD